jgi:hypothetical protein
VKIRAVNLLEDSIDSQQEEVALIDLEITALIVEGMDLEVEVFEVEVGVVGVAEEAEVGKENKKNDPNSLIWSQPSLTQLIKTKP